MSVPYSLPQISYWVAYRVLPEYAFEAAEMTLETWGNNPAAAGPYYYRAACQMAGLTLVAEDARQYSAALGTFGDHDYFLLEYPVPPPVGMGAGMVLAPHFSIIVRHRVSGEVSYFVLGQSLNGGTTFRSVTASGMNANLGPGPAPQRDLFLERVRQALPG